MAERRKRDAIDVASTVGNDEYGGDVEMQVRTRGDGTRDAIFWPVGWAKLSEHGRELVSDIQHLVLERQRRLEQLDALVAELRAEGASWTVIGWCTGMTQQAAHKRWGPEKEPGT
jgi:hypothetical protein